MEEQKNREHAKVVFETLCQTLDTLNWNYQKDEDELSVECGAQGDDLPIDITVDVNVDSMLVVLISHIPFVIQEDKRLDIAIVISAINNALVDGSFDYDIESGRIFFRMTNSFIDSKIGEEVFAYMLYGACKMVDEYNDKILMVAKGVLSVEQFLSTFEN